MALGNTSFLSFLMSTIMILNYFFPSHYIYFYINLMTSCYTFTFVLLRTDIWSLTSNLYLNFSVSLYVTHTAFIFARLIILFGPLCLILKSHRLFLINCSHFDFQLFRLNFSLNTDWYLCVREFSSLFCTIERKIQLLSKQVVGSKVLASYWQKQLYLTHINKQKNRKIENKNYLGYFPWVFVVLYHVSFPISIHLLYFKPENLLPFINSVAILY